MVYLCTESSGRIIRPASGVSDGRRKESVGKPDYSIPILLICENCEIGWKMAELVSGVLDSVWKLLLGNVLLLYSAACDGQFLCLLCGTGQKMEAIRAGRSLFYTLCGGALYLFAGDKRKIAFLYSVDEVIIWNY